MSCERRVLCLMLHLKCAVSPVRYFPYKCSTKSSFMWFGMQWTYIFKIWNSLTEGFVCVDCSRMRLCAQNSCKHSQLCLTGLNHITSYISKEIRAWMQLNRSPAVYDVIVKNNSKDEEKSLSSWMENVQIILNTESTLCLLYVSMLLFIICYLLVYVLKLY